mgnify:CR=1 FL=1
MYDLSCFILRYLLILTWEKFDFSQILVPSCFIIFYAFGVKFGVELI